MKKLLITLSFCILGYFYSLFFTSLEIEAQMFYSKIKNLKQNLKIAALNTSEIKANIDIEISNTLKQNESSKVNENKTSDSAKATVKGGSCSEQNYCTFSREKN